jgi:hypothetical protein
MSPDKVTLATLFFKSSSAESKTLFNCSSFLVGKLRRFRVEGSVLFLEGRVNALLILLGGWGGSYLI